MVAVLAAQHAQHEDADDDEQENDQDGAHRKANVQRHVVIFGRFRGCYILGNQKKNINNNLSLNSLQVE